MDTLSTTILAAALFIIMLGMGLSLKTEDFKRIFKFPKAIVVGLTNQLLVLPIIGFSIAYFFSLPPEIAIGIMILAACPGGPTSNLISYLAKGDLALSVTLTAFSSIITIVSIPFVVGFALQTFAGEEQQIALNIPQTIGQIFVIVVIPIALGMLVKNLAPAFALKMGKPVRIGSGAVLALIIIGLVLKERANFIAYFKQAGLAALLLNVGTMILGFISAKVLKLPKDQAVSIAVESGIQNGTLAISIAVLLLNSTAYAIAPAVYSLLMFITGFAVIYVANRKH